MNDVALLSDISASSATGDAAGNQARRNSILVVALALFAFAIYACAVFTLLQVRNTLACCESSGIAAAISNIKYGTPLGSLYSGVFSYFDNRIQEPLSLALQQAQLPGVWTARNTARSVVRDDTGR